MEPQLQVIKKRERKFDPSSLSIEQELSFFFLRLLSASVLGREKNYIKTERKEGKKFLEERTRKNEKERRT